MVIKNNIKNSDQWHFLVKKRAPGCIKIYFKKNSKKPYKEKNDI